LRTNPYVNAVITTVLFAGTLGVLIAVTGFGVIRILEEMLEALGTLPLRWGENNVTTLMAIAGVASIPVVVWFSFWFYRKALNAERILTASERS
jgi:glycerol-3-phosphate acyltransferase PlsY